MAIERKRVWGDDVGLTWDTASNEVKEEFALVRLFWFQRMVQAGGPDGSELDAEVVEQAKEAADWFGPILRERAGV